MFIFKFMTYNQALLYDRLERMCVVAVAMYFVGMVEYFISTDPTWVFTSIAAIGGQILIFKCWADLITMNRPHENCWAFKG